MPLVSTIIAPLHPICCTAFLCLSVHRRERAPSIDSGAFIGQAAQSRRASRSGRNLVPPKSWNDTTRKNPTFFFCISIFLSFAWSICVELEAVSLTIRGFTIANLQVQRSHCCGCSCLEQLRKHPTARG